MGKKRALVIMDRRGEILEDLKEIKEEKNKITKDVYRREGEFSLNQINRCFGKWINAKKLVTECKEYGTNGKGTTIPEKMGDILKKTIEDPGIKDYELERFVSVKRQKLDYILNVLEKELNFIKRIGDPKGRIRRVLPTQQGINFYFGTELKNKVIDKMGRIKKVDKTEKYDYREESPEGEDPPEGERWKTPRELATDVIDMLGGENKVRYE